MCSLLGAQTPDEAVSRVETLKEQLDALDERDDVPDDLVTLSEFEQVLTRLHKKISSLRQRNNKLETRLEEVTRSGEDTSGNALLEALDAATYETALDRIQTLKQQANAFYEDRQAVLEAGYNNATEVVADVKALKRENERLNEARTEERARPDTEVLQAASSIRAVLGISTISEAEAFVEKLDQLSTSVRRALDRLGMDVPQTLSIDRAADVSSFLEVLTEQINRLAEAPLPDEGTLEARETLNQIESILGIASADDAREMEEMVRQLTEEMEMLAQEHETLEAHGLTAEQAVSMIQSMDEQLDDLYIQHDVNEKNGDLPPGLKEMLGVDSVEKAQEILGLAESMDTKIEKLYDEQEKLSELGIDSIDEAVRMIQNMNEQLAELYRNVEARASAASLPVENQDTFQQLEALYARQEKLQDELGISDPDAIIQMVEDMNVQLETLYEDRDETKGAPFDGGDEEGKRSPERLDRLVESMVDQLEVLYQEKETLTDEGFESAEEATEQINELRDQVETLRSKYESEVSGSQAWKTLQEKLDVETPEEVLDRLDQYDAEQSRTAASSNGEETGAAKATAASASSDGDTSGQPTAPAVSSAVEQQPNPVWHAAPPVADAATRRQLASLTAEERDDLDFAAIAVDHDGHVTSLNDKAYALPLFDRMRSREEALDTHFFLDLAPSTAADSFYGRFYEGQRQQRLDARFLHLFDATSWRGPFVALVHLYYDSETDTSWILLRTSDQ